MNLTTNYFATINVSKEIFNYKSRIIFNLLFVLLFFNLDIFAQPPEPQNFDWKVSYQISNKLESFYDKDVIKDMPGNSRFWVDIKPISSVTEKITYVKDELMIYESNYKREKKINNIKFNHGLYQSIKTPSGKYYSLMSDPKHFKKMNSKSDDKNHERLTLVFDHEFNLSSIRNGYREDKEWIRFFKDDQEWFASDLVSAEFSFDPANNVVETYDPKNDIYESIQYAEVYPSIWKPTLRIITYNEETVDGVCLEKRETSAYSDYSYEINQVSNRNLNQEELVEVKLRQIGSEIYLESEYDESFDLVIYSVSGVALQSIDAVTESFRFSPPSTGIYFIHFKNDSKQFTTKVFFNKK